MVDDGRDVLFGDVGHDWLVGGTNRDVLFGGYGDDLLQADDDLDTTFGTADPLANDTPDRAPRRRARRSFADIAFGGAGRDVLIANTFTDRMYDLREFDSFFVPFAAFGNPTVNRSLPPGAEELALHPLQGRRRRPDARRHRRPQRRAVRRDRPGHNADADWGDQNGAPSTRSPGNRPGQRDTGSTAEFGIWTDADNGSAMLLSVADATVTEADAGTTVVSVVVTRSGPATGTVTVTVSTAPGTALAGSDYQSRTTTLTFAPGVTQVTFSVNIVNNNTTEPTEQFSVVLSNPSGATIADRTGIVTIIDDDGVTPALVATGAAPHPASAEPLSADDVSVALESAREVWTRTGRDTSSLDCDHGRGGRPPGCDAREADGSVIRLDVDAAGWGWATAAAPGAGRIDLVTVLAHELGHILGLTHDDADVWAIMAPVLAPGPAPRRQLPSSVPAARSAARSAHSRGRSGVARSQSGAAALTGVPSPGWWEVDCGKGSYPAGCGTRLPCPRGLLHADHAARDSGFGRRGRLGRPG